MTTPVTREEFTRQMDELRESMGEMRRKGEERHAENVRRFEALEKMPARVEQLGTQLETLGTRLAENTASTNRVEANTKTMVMLMQVGKLAMSTGELIQRGVIWISKLAVAAAVLWAIWLWLVGRGPFPPIGH